MRGYVRNSTWKRAAGDGTSFLKRGFHAVAYCPGCKVEVLAFDETVKDARDKLARLFDDCRLEEW